ncbi:MAG: PIN domain-containing protein, partial [Candidatus Methanoperedens sp.]
YQPTKEEFSQLWKDSVLVFDANVLLNIYRYSQETSETLIDIFSKFSDRLWVPHQAASEYQRRRLGVIGKQESAYKDIQGLLTKEQKQIEKELNTYKMHPFIKVADILEKIKNNFNEIEKDLDILKQKHPDLSADDELRDKITELFNGKVGSSYSPEKLEEIYKTGKKRYERKIPPGFEDKEKDGVREYGDLVLWFQIIDHAKSIKKPIIFVTDDRKEDWWLKFNVQTIGPQPELINEIFTTAGADFYMYQTERFIEYAQKYLKEKVNQKAIKEIREIKKSDEEHMKKLMEIISKAVARQKEEEEKIQSIIRVFKGRKVIESVEDCPDDCGSEDCPDDCGPEDCPD